MRRARSHFSAVAVVLTLSVAPHARAEEPLHAPVVVVRTPRALDVSPYRLMAPAVQRLPLGPTPAPREVKLSEEGLVLVVASCIIGGVILVYLVSRATSH